MIVSFEGVLFECSSGPKVVTIREDMSLDASRKTIMDTIGGRKILLVLFYCQLVVMVVLNTSVWSLNATMM